MHTLVAGQMWPPCCASTLQPVLAALRSPQPWHRAKHGKRLQCARRDLSRSAALPRDGLSPPLQGLVGSFDAAWLWQQSLVMGLASAILGPLCDGQHSSHDVLHYAHPMHLALGPLQLETCWWVPLMFAVAGIILGVSYPLLDLWQQEWGGRQPRGGADPPWPFVLAAVALFVCQYGASGALEQPLLGHMPMGSVPPLDALLLVTGVAIWWAFDATPQGLAMACLTAMAGPAVEITLINAFHLYAYLHPALLGVPAWIPWVYFGGAPAVGSLGRKVSSALLSMRAAPPTLEP